MKKEDLMFYLAYIILFILAGVWLLLWAVDVLTGIADVIMVWILSAGVMMLVFGNIKTRRKPKGDSTLVLGGLITTIVMLLLLALAHDMLEVWVMVGLAVIMVGITGLAYFLMRIRGTIED